jgi:hypothetical protein
MSHPLLKVLSDLYDSPNKGIFDDLITLQTTKISDEVIQIYKQRQDFKIYQEIMRQLVKDEDIIKWELCNNTIFILSKLNISEINISSSLSELL